MKENIQYLKSILQLGEKPGYLLVGYFFVKVFFSRAKTDMGAVDISSIVFAFYALGAGLYSWTLFSRDDFGRYFRSILFKKTPMLYFLLYTLLCFISASWSMNPILSAYRAVECLGFTILIACVVCTLLKNTNIEGMVQWSVAYATITVLLMFVNGYLGGGMYLGLYNSQFTATMFFFLSFYCARKKWMKYTVLLIALACRSTTGYIGMALGLSSLLVGSRKYRWAGVLFLGILLAAIMLVGIDDVLNNTVFYSKGGAVYDGEMNMAKTSGRDAMWDSALQYIDRNELQWTGLGFFVGELELARKTLGTVSIGMHNGLMSAYVGTGIFGTILFGLFLFRFILVPFSRFIPNGRKSLLIACMCVAFVHTMGNPGLGTRVYGTWIPAMFIVMITLGTYISQKYYYEEFSDDDSTEIIDKRTGEIIS